MDFYDYIDRLNNILLPTSHRYDAIYNKLNLGSSGGHGYASTSPLICIDDQLTSINCEDKIRIQQIFNQIDAVTELLKSAILAEKAELKSITIIQNILNPCFKEVSKKRILDLSFYLEWLNKLQVMYNEEKSFWDNLLKDVN